MSDAEIRALRNLAVNLTEALEEIAKQKLSAEMDEETRKNADWLDGYETCVRRARAVLKS